MRKGKIRIKLLCALLCIIMCIAASVSVLAADEMPEITGVNISGDTLSWDEFEGADDYEIQGGSGSWAVTGTSCNLAELFGARGYTSGAYTIRIFARKDYRQVSGSVSVTYNYVSKNPQLDTPTGFSWNGSVVSWSPVTNATSYRVLLCRDSFGSYPTVIDVTTTCVDISERLDEGTRQYGVMVQAMANGYPSSEYGKSEFNSITKTYPEIQNANISGDILSWDAFEGADDYEIQGGNGNWAVTGTSCDLVELFEARGYTSGTYTIKIFARKDYKQVSQSATLTYEYTGRKAQLDTPTGFSWSGRTVSWSPVANATSYQVFLCRDSFESTPTVFDVTGTSVDINRYLEEGTRQYGVMVKAQADGYPSSEYGKSEMTTITYGMPSITNVSIDDGVMSWDAFDGAVSYKYSIIGAFESIGTTPAVSLDLDNTMAAVHGIKGQYVISLYATDEDGNRISKIWTKDDWQYAPKHEIKAIPADEKWGTVTGGREYREGDTVTLEATAAEGYTFDYWTDQWGCVIDGVGAEYIFTLEAGSSEQYAAWFKEKAVGEWKRNSKGWWYEFSDGSYYDNGLYEIDGAVYGFNASGYMVTGWYKFDEKWYYFKSSGAMLTGWQKINNKWYYLVPASGEMLTGLRDIDGSRYYLDKSGAMLTGWQSIDGEWYFFSKSGAMVTAAWEGDYYLAADGKMVRYAYIKNGEKYYWVNDNGKYTKTYKESDTPGYLIFDQATGYRIYL